MNDAQSRAVPDVREDGGLLVRKALSEGRRSHYYIWWVKE